MNVTTDRWWRPMSRADRSVVLGLIALPLIVFGVPALLGHPAIAADNLIQNFPLRVLTGEQLRSGHLPLLNPLANSSTPLLGGMNAGSFFPATFLFVIAPPILAWILNLALVYATAALGLFALLRWHGQRTAAAAVAALVFAYSGSMIGQMVHFGVIEGFALLPWAVLAMLAMGRAIRRAAPTRAARLRSLVPGVLILSVLWALACLSGEPRAIAEMELLAMIVGPCVVLLPSDYRPVAWRERGTYLAALVLSVVWGLVIGLAQLLPGLNFITHSQRSSISYSFFGAGSLFVRWTSMLFVQNIVGGNGLLGQPRFFADYNLPEVTGYVGVLALVAVAAFVGRVSRRGWPGENGHYVVYVVMLVVGLFAAWGSYTPLGHLFQYVPLVGSTRLQSRNLVLVDLAATVLLGWMLDRLLARDLAGAGLVGRRRWWSVAPAFVTVALGAVMLLWGPPIARWMGARPAAAVLSRHQTLTFVIQIVIAVTLVGLLLGARASRHLVRWLGAVVALDVAVFLLLSSTGFVAGNVNVMPSRAAAVADFGSHGRFAVIDPRGIHSEDFERLGSPNMNVFTKFPSVQGYGSLINSLYGDVTDTHPLFSIRACQLARGTFEQLRLAVVVISGDQLATPVTSATPHPTWCLPLRTTTTTSRFFGQMERVRTISVEGPGGRSVTNGPITAQLFGANDRPVGPLIQELGAPSMVFHFSTTTARSAGVRFNAPFGATLYSTTLQPIGEGAPRRLDNGYQEAFSTTWWHMGETSGSLTIFRANHVRATAWLGKHSSPSKILKVSNASWGDSWITVRATHVTTLKRSVEWLPGWRATAVNQRSGEVRALLVDRSGLIMQVTVPTGTWQIHFHYHAPYIELGLVASTTGVVALLAVEGWRRGRFTRYRNGRVQT